VKRLTGPFLVLLAAAFFAWPFVCVTVLPVSGDEQSPEDFGLVGVKKCKMCHKAEKSGNQFGTWEAGPHAKAYEVLASEKSMAVAKERGIENPQTAPECLRCHVTAFPVMADLENQKITLEEGVSCESCHGAGDGYWKKSTMEAVFAGEIEAASVGLMMPTAETCTGCHNEDSPFFEGFNFEEAAAKIAHHYPEGYPAKE